MPVAVTSVAAAPWPAIVRLVSMTMSLLSMIGETPGSITTRSPGSASLTALRSEPAPPLSLLTTCTVPAAAAPR